MNDALSFHKRKKNLSYEHEWKSRNEPQSKSLDERKT